MSFRTLTPDYAVSPQITPEDVPAIRAAGFVRVICNRPDGEIPPELQAEAIGRAVAEAGMEFVLNPVISGAMTLDNVKAQGEAIDSAAGPVFAYCASGNRSSIVWELSQAGRRSTDDLIGAATAWGYNLEPYREQIDALAASRKA